jgi:hypothetical protein
VIVTRSFNARLDQIALIAGPFAGLFHGLHHTKMNLSISVTVFPGSALITEPHASLGVDIQAPSGTPIGKRVGIDIDFLEGLTVTPELVHDVLRLIEPLVVG